MFQKFGFKYIIIIFKYEGYKGNLILIDFVYNNGRLDALIRIQKLSEKMLLNKRKRFWD